MKTKHSLGIWAYNIWQNLFLVTLTLLFALVGSQSSAAEIAVGGNHTVALQEDGTVWAWGYDYYGQLGDGGTTTQTSAVQVKTGTGNLINVLDVSAGANHSLAVDNSGHVWAWGNNGNGQLGNGTTTSSSTAVMMLTASGTLSGIVDVAAGDNFSLMLKSDGTVWATGLNSNGQLGIGTTTGTTRAVQVSITGTVTQIAGGGTHSLAIKSDGTVWAWGSNGNGQLATGTTTQQNTPVQTQFSGTTKAIAAGAAHSLAVKNDGTVWACGYNNTCQLGDGTGSQRTSPVQVLNLTGITSVAAGAGHSVALGTSGTAWVWGSNDHGQLGDGKCNNSLSTAEVFPVSGGATVIAARSNRTLAVSTGGVIYGAGDDFYGPLCNGAVGYQTTPVGVLNLTSLKQVSAGAYHSAALKSDGTVWAFGLGNSGQLGSGTTNNANVAVQVYANSSLSTYLQNVAAVSAGGYHCLALTGSGTVVGWGYAGYGQLGNGSVGVNQYNYPVGVLINSGTALTGVTAVAGGGYHSLALTSGGTVWAWGRDTEGELGNNSTTNSPYAVQVVTGTGPLTGVIAIAAGEYHSLALTSSGTVYAWGSNGNGQLGNGTYTSGSLAAPISLSGTTIKAIAAGGSHSVAITSANTLLAWGSNQYGQLGDTTVTQRTTPVAVSTVSSAQWIATGIYGTMAAETNGSVWTWGANDSGEVGNGTIDLNAHSTPQQVSALVSATNTGACGWYHNVVIQSDLTAKAWANKEFGQLGNGTYGYVTPAVQASFTVVSDTTGLWVNQNATAGGDGSYAKPFQTIAAALTQSAKVSDTNNRITICSGTYCEALMCTGSGANGPWVSKSGTPGNPFIIRGMPGQRVIVSGFRQTPTWVLSSGSIYTTQVSGSFAYRNPYPDTFYCGMNERLIAQFPKVGSATWTWQSGVATSGSTTITDTNHLVGVGNLVGGYIQYLGAGENLEVTGRYILANDPVAGKLTFTGSCGDASAFYVVKNRLQMLNGPGQWACIPQASGSTDYVCNLYYWPVNAAELTSMLSSTPGTAVRTGTVYYNGGMGPLVSLNHVHDVTLQGLEVMGCSGGGIGVISCTNANVSWNLIHDNGGHAWASTTGTTTNTTAYGGSGIMVVASTGCTISNNSSYVNMVGMSVSTGTNCTVTQNDIGYNCTDGIVVGTGCPNLNITNNYIHHHNNIYEHPDAIQTYTGTTTGNWSNNCFLADVQMMFNGVFSGTLQNNVSFVMNFNGANTGQNTWLYNTIQGWLSASGTTAARSGTGIGNVVWGVICGGTGVYTGNYNLAEPYPMATGSYNGGQFFWLGGPGGNRYYGWAGIAGTLSDWIALMGQDQNSVISGTSGGGESGFHNFINIPIDLCNVNATGSNFVSNSGSTTVDINTPQCWGGGGGIRLGLCAVGNHIEWCEDGVVRQITAVDAVKGTITFTPALWAFTQGDGCGYAPWNRDAWIENWGASTNFARDSRLNASSPGLTMGPGGTAVGSSINIGQYQAGSLDGTGLMSVPTMPDDVKANVLNHNFHISSWVNYGQ